MKKFRILTAFVAFAAFLGLTSCSDDPAELLNGGQGPAGSTILNVNYTVPGDSTKVFYATYVSANVQGLNITVTAENEDTGESLVIDFTGNKVQNDNAVSYKASVTYIDASGNEYDSYSPFSASQTGALRLKDINTEKHTISGVFSFIGHDGTEAAAADAVPFFSGIFMEVPYTGVLPEPTYIKATVDSTFVDYENTYTDVTSDTIVAFKGSNTTPKHSVEIKFADNSDVTEGATIELGPKLTASFKVGDVNYIAKTGSVKITTVKEDVVTGTFLFSAATEDNTETIQITGGQFKMLLE